MDFFAQVKALVSTGRDPRSIVDDLIKLVATTEAQSLFAASAPAEDAPNAAVEGDEVAPV